MFAQLNDLGRSNIIRSGGIDLWDLLVFVDLSFMITLGKFAFMPSSFNAQIYLGLI